MPHLTGAEPEVHRGEQAAPAHAAGQGLSVPSHCPTSHSKSSVQAQRLKRQKPRHRKGKGPAQGYTANVCSIGTHTLVSLEFPSLRASHLGKKAEGVLEALLRPTCLFEGSVKVCGAGWLQQLRTPLVPSMGATVSDGTNPGSGLERRSHSCKCESCHTLSPPPHSSQHCLVW